RPRPAARRGGPRPRRCRWTRSARAGGYRRWPAPRGPRPRRPESEPSVEPSAKHAIAPRAIAILAAMDDRVAALRGVPLFADLDERGLQAVAILAREMTAKAGD